MTVVQSIGRGLRLHPDKKELNIWDIVDTNYKYAKKHAEKRQEIYATEKNSLQRLEIFLSKKKELI